MQLSHHFIYFLLYVFLPVSRFSSSLPFSISPHSNMNNKDGQTHKLRYRGTEIAPKSTVDVGHTGESLFCRVDTASLVDVRPKGHKPSIGF